MPLWLQREESVVPALCPSALSHVYPVGRSRPMVKLGTAARHVTTRQTKAGLNVLRAEAQRHSGGLSSHIIIRTPYDAV
jgi:hypothetical protein